MNFKFKISGLALSFVVLASGIFSCLNSRKIDYSLDVKPILNRKCIACHGGVKKQGGFSLLFEEEAFAKLKSGKYGIVPGHPESSEMIRRLELHDPEERMPYKANPLTKEEIATLTNWVKQGAKWGQHWAYKSVEKPEIPNIKSDWSTNDIDAYVLEKQKEVNLNHAQQADPNSLARRASLDLVGFPVNSKKKGIFLENPSNKNYEALIDTLLASPHFGEKWTSMWLDLARYADTKGYERDGGRTIWRYRDWLIKAFNDDKPYNQFLTEQLAGDLLPNPTDDQLIATAFHRNTMTNDEGGTDNEEFRTAAVLDRVNTTWETLMGTTFACVQCHSHPYDPFKHEDYYRFAAFFNNTRDEDTYDDYPLIRHFDETQSKKLEELNLWLNANCSKQEANNILKFVKTLQPTYNSLTTDQFINSALSDTKWLAMRNNASARLKKVDLTNKRALVFKYKANAAGGRVQVKSDSLNGKEIGVFPIKAEAKSWEVVSINLLPTAGVHNLYFTYFNPQIKDQKQTGVVFDWFYFTNNFPGETNNGQKESEAIYWDLVKAKTDVTPIMIQNPQDFSRENKVFIRGNWLMKGESVKPGVPKIFSTFVKSQPNDRLEMAKWLTSPKHPLTARTIVNRLWEQLFGTGLVETLEDIGSQGALPSNQKLLDYLSYKLVNDYNWSMKKLLKEIMMSSTYRQDSKLSPETAKKDLANEYFTRGPRIRLSAEQIRDQALAIAGVLNNKMNGPPVMPWQPNGIWHSPYDSEKWNMSGQNDQYRRAVYTYWKRTSAYPSMLSFDGVGREVCSSRRIRTNTPLQALVTLNDSAYVEISRKLTQKVWTNATASPVLKISKMYELATDNKISTQKLEILLNLYQKSLAEYKTKPKEADKICKGIVTDKKMEFSAMAIVANAILNLDEILTKS